MSTSSCAGGDFGFLIVRKERTVRSTVSWPKTEHASDIGSMKLRLDFMAMGRSGIDQINGELFALIIDVQLFELYIKCNKINMTARVRQLRLDPP